MKDQYPVQFGTEETEKMFHLKCKVFKIHEGAQQGVQGGQSEYDAVVLYPEDNDQATRFYRAWLPEQDIEGQNIELVGYIKSPVDCKCRFSIHRRSSRFPLGNYLFVMSKGVEDILLRHFLGKTVDVKTFKGSQDAQADDVVGSNTSFDVIE